MLQVNEISNRRNVFLPPIKKNKLTLSNNDPVLYENNLKKDSELLEIGLDKFSILTNQPNTIEKIKFKKTPWPEASSDFDNLLNNNNNNMTSSFEWNSKEMPKLKINRSSDLSLDTLDNPSTKKKKLLFEQKLILEQKQMEQSYRNIRANEYLNRSNETYKRISNRDKHKENTSFQHFKKDVWGSTDYKDINLQTDIINTFYSLDNRAIRHFRQQRNDFFEFTPNRNYEKLKESSSTNINQ
ncbi:unnamed protein product [Brachionus calyciflorus]|uniref:Uncharacterized protein n=1 Tax=Brachionus calyciflorus TaxID=104777 RepID=A0A813N6I0_9BILA|nr:unnamed protein product [Brachionus calyciflorus]